MLFVIAAAVLATSALAQSSAPSRTTGANEAGQQRSTVEQIRQLLAQGRNDQALADAQGALERFPRNPQIRFLHAVSLTENGRVDDAVPAFEALTQEYPELPEPYNNLAVLYAGRGELERARVALEQALRAQPRYALALENLGDVHLRLAARAYEQAGQVDPASAAAREKLGLARDLIDRIAATGAGATKR